MLKLSFSDHDIDRLHYERFHHPHPRVQLKMEALYLKSQGLAHKQIGELVGICQNTLVAYFRQYQQGGVEALKELHFYEPPSALDPHRESLEAYFRAHPPTTVKHAAAVIAERTGVVRKQGQVRLFLRSLGLRCRKVGQVPAKAEPEAQETFQKKSSCHVWKKPAAASGRSSSSMPPTLCSAPFLASSGASPGSSSPPRRAASASTSSAP
jgi:transposase